MKTTFAVKLLTAACLAASVTTSDAALITWDASASAVNYSTPSQVLTGITAGSFTFSSTDIVVNGMTFSRFTGIASSVGSFNDARVKLHFGSGGTVAASTLTGGQESTFNDYATMIGQGIGANTPYTATRIEFSNLSIGTAYTVQLWALVSSNTWGTRFSSSSDYSTGVSSYVRSAGSPVFQSKQVPQFIKGTFTATAATQDVFYQGQFQTSLLSSGQLVTAIPEPSTWVLAAGIAGIAVVAVMRRRRA